MSRDKAGPPSFVVLQSHPSVRLLRGQDSLGSHEECVVACTAEEDKARQEYALSSNLSYQVQKFGMGIPPKFGEQDFDAMDMTKAFEIVERAQLAWLELPKVVRDRYQTWANVEAAALSGELSQVLKAAGAEGGSSPSAAAAAVGAGGTSPEAPKGP